MENRQNYFAFYGIPVALSVDAAALRRAYLDKSREHHPDFHTLATAEEQASALDLSTYNNDAYKTLSDPDQRLKYVLKIKGLLEEESNAALLSQDFLMEVMEINEKIMELEFDPAPGIYEEAVSAVGNIENQMLAEAKSILETWTEANGEEKDLIIARDYYLKKRYLLRVKENLSKFASAFE